jgi:hypothetical protein
MYVPNDACWITRMSPPLNDVSSSVERTMQTHHQQVILTDADTFGALVNGNRRRKLCCEIWAAVRLVNVESRDLRLLTSPLAELEGFVYK